MIFFDQLFDVILMPAATLAALIPEPQFGYIAEAICFLIKSSIYIAYICLIFAFVVNGLRWLCSKMAYRFKEHAQKGRNETLEVHWPETKNISLTCLCQDSADISRLQREITAIVKTWKTSLILAVDRNSLELRLFWEVVPEKTDYIHEIEKLARRNPNVQFNIKTATEREALTDDSYSC